MIPVEELGAAGFQLLEVDNNVVLPLIIAADVLHLWAVPALGVKMDATPGRLSQTSFFINRSGLFYGQCSEICGTNQLF